MIRDLIGAPSVDNKMRKQIKMVYACSEQTIKLNKLELNKRGV